MTIVAGVVQPDYDTCVDAPVGNTIIIEGPEGPPGPPGTSCPLFCGTGSPEGVVTSPIGGIYEQTDAASTSHSIWFKHSGTGNTGWRAWAGMRGGDGANTALRMGDSSVASGVESIAIGEGAEVTATVVGGIAIGPLAKANTDATSSYTAETTISIGTAEAKRKGDIVIGSALTRDLATGGNVASTGQGIFIGHRNECNSRQDPGSIIIGNDAKLINFGFFSDVVIGLQAWGQNGGGNVVIGENAGAFDTTWNGPGNSLEAVSVGYNSRSQGDCVVAVGHDADADGDFCTAVGPHAHAGNGSALITDCNAMGRFASALGHRSNSIGANSSVTAARGNTLGESAIVAHSDSIAIGCEAVSSQANELTIGSTLSPINNVRIVGSGTFGFGPSASSGVNQIGKNSSLNAGAGTGNAVASELAFKTPTPGASGGVVQTLTTRARITEKVFESRIGVSLPVRTIAVDETLVHNDHTVIVDSASPVTVTLMAAAGAFANGSGLILHIKRIGAGTATVEGNGAETIDGAANYVLAADETLTIQSNGTEWFII